jgi:hypothetical protein
VQLVRRAFQETLKDPAFVAEAEKARLTLDPATGEELARIVEGLSKLDAAFLARLKEVLYQ